MSCDTRTYHDLPRYTTLWYIVNVVFIESRAFTRRLLALGKKSLEVLSAIQGDLLDNPERGRVVQGLAGIRKARAADPGRGKGKRGGFRYLYLYVIRTTSTCCICSTRMSRGIWTFRNAMTFAFTRRGSKGSNRRKRNG